MSTEAPRADPARAQELAAALRRVGFDAVALDHALSTGDDGAETRVSELPDARATALRLFVLGVSVDEAAASLALGKLGVDGAVALGVVRREGRVVHPTLRLVPHDVLLLASDLPSDAPAADHVAAAHAPSLALAQLTVRRRVERALDLGTGNGVQALMLATHATHVVATDVNERALRFTELNAALNGRSNIETRLASFLEPIPDELFGVVVCSPPYVISPEAQLLYRDAALRGDAIGEHLVRSVPTLLEPGGYATLLVSWVADVEQPRPLEWAEGSGCDALVIQLRVESGRETAEYWHADLPSDQANGGIDRWLAYYARESIEHIGYGAVVLRRREGLSWIESVEVPGGPAGHAGDHLERLFRAHEGPLRVAGRSFLWSNDTVLNPADDGIELSLRRGLPFRVALDAAAAKAAATAGSGRIVPPAAAPLVQQLVELGFLVPVAD